MEYFDMRKMSVNLWRNAAGETREICTFPPAKRDFYWRASIASIAANGEFSLFPGMERIVTLLEGGEMFLESADLKAKLTAGQMSMDFNIMTRLDVCKAKVRIAERTFTTFGSRGGVVFVINGAWQLGDKLLTTDQGACWFDGRHTLRLLQPQGKLLFSEINWLAGHSPDQVQ
ncbi:MAG: HutD family protein [Escherichia coli]|nr:HutD family protein [Escherichia coli]